MVFGIKKPVVSAWWLEASREWIVDGRYALRGGWGPTSVLYWALRYACFACGRFVFSVSRSGPSGAWSNGVGGIAGKRKGPPDVSVLWTFISFARRFTTVPCLPPPVPGILYHPVSACLRLIYHVVHLPR